MGIKQGLMMEVEDIDYLYRDFDNGYGYKEIMATCKETGVRVKMKFDPIKEDPKAVRERLARVLDKKITIMNARRA